MYDAEYYDATAADESDPDPMFVIESDNLDDIFSSISNHLKTETVATYLDTDAGYDRYGINDANDPTHNLGVVVIGVIVR